MRAPRLKANIYVYEVQTESVDGYRHGRMELEQRGYALFFSAFQKFI